MSTEPRAAAAAHNPTCEGCGEVGLWETSEKPFALLPLSPGGSLHISQRISGALSVRVLRCENCGYLRFYDARYL